VDRTDVNWSGYWVAPPTPFSLDGPLDEAAWRGLLHLYCHQGVHGVLVNGTTGEWFSQSDDERRRVAEIAVEELKGKMPVVIGCTTFTPRHTAELAQHAQHIGADGVLSTPPPYVVPTEREVLAFYQALSDSTKLPIMAYNWPRGTNFEIRRAVALKLSEIDRVVAIKDSTADKVQAMETLEAVVDRVRVFGTFINRVGLGLLREIGGDGNIDGGGLGAVYGVGFYNAYWKQDLEAAHMWAQRYVALSAELINPDFSGRFGSPQSQLKAAMNMLGQPGGYPRPPLLPVDDPNVLSQLSRVLESAGLKTAATISPGVLER
jgi:1-pyrroline-4-hydroxy-2-carboxylate deaminase